MLIHRLVQLCWCALALCLWIFADVLRQNLFTENITKNAPTSIGVSCGTITNTPVIPENEIELFKRGKRIFKNYCASCHNKNMKDDMTGPALSGVEERWADYPREDLYNWIKNSQKLASEKHPRAVTLVKEWNNTTMTSFPNLSDEEIEDILLFIRIYSE